MTSPEEWKLGGQNGGGDGAEGFALGFCFASGVGGPGWWSLMAVVTAKPSSSSFWGHFRVRRSSVSCRPSPHGFSS